MPASYPNAVKTFTTRSAGQTIDPSHVNDLQDEVHAIEDGLLNGIAPINSSRITAPALQISAGSTLATLNVTGGSTLATLSVSGNSTLASTITIGSQKYVFPSSAAGSSGDVLTCIATGASQSLEWRTPTASVGPFSVTATSDVKQEIASSTGRFGLNWPLIQTIKGAASMISTSANSSRITFVNSTGMYLVGCSIYLGKVSVAAGSTGGYLQLSAMFNDGSLIAQQTVAANADSSVAFGMQCVAVIRATSTSDYATFTIQHNTGSTTSISSNAAGTPVQVWATFLST